MRKLGHFVIRGRVQGVCFRMYACEEARALGLLGWVRNRPDGTVEVEVEGDERALDSFLAWCRQGPPSAKVIEVVAVFRSPSGKFTRFEIRL